MYPKEEAIIVHTYMHINVWRIFYGRLKKIEVTVDARAVIRNNTKGPCVPFTQFTPMVPHSRTAVQYNNQDIENDTIHQFIWIFQRITLKNEKVEIEISQSKGQSK